jgi:hypothetical protein
MNEMSIAVGTSAPITSPSARQISRAAKAGDKSVINLHTNHRKGGRQEGLVWLVLTLSAALLIVLRLRI